MDNDTLKKIQSTENEILNAVKDVCEKNDLTYYLICGTLLGAVRHSGFIPWDDDVDIAMPYKDFQRFMEIGQAELGDAYFIQNHLTDKYFHAAYAKVRKNNTAMIQMGNKDAGKHQGIWIDVVPLIEINGGLEYKIKSFILKISNHLQTDKHIECNLDEFISIYGEKKIKLMRLAHKLPICFRQRLHSVMLRFVFNGSNKRFLGEVWGNIQSHKKEVFGKHPEDVLFNGVYHKCPADYDRYLTEKYGDYMQLPPIEKRRNHNIEFISFDCSVELLESNR